MLTILNFLKLGRRRLGWFWLTQKRWPNDKHQDSIICVKECIQPNLSLISSQWKVGMVKKTSYGFEEETNDWKLFKTNINQRNRGDKCTLKEKQQCCLWHLKFCFWIFLYFCTKWLCLCIWIIFFVFLSLILICIAGQMLLGWEHLPCQYFIIICPLCSMNFSWFQLQSGPFQTKLKRMTKFLTDIISFVYINTEKQNTIWCIRSNWKQALTHWTPVWT